MSLGAHQQKVAAAEAKLIDASQRLRVSWSGLKQEGSAALTPGRVVVSGLLTGYFGGMLTSGSKPDAEASEPRGGGDGVSLLLALIQLGTALVPQLLPSLAPAFRAGMAAGSARKFADAGNAGAEAGT